MEVRDNKNRARSAVRQWANRATPMVARTTLASIDAVFKLGWRSRRLDLVMALLPSGVVAGMTTEAREDRTTPRLFRAVQAPLDLASGLKWRGWYLSCDVGASSFEVRCRTALVRRWPADGGFGFSFTREKEFLERERPLLFHGFFVNNKYVPL